MKAVIEVDVPEYQIGQEVSVYFKDTMCIKGVCQKDKELNKNTEPDKYAKEFFHGICPYTGRKCDTWNCNECEVEQAERKWLEEEKEVLDKD